MGHPEKDDNNDRKSEPKWFNRAQIKALQAEYRERRRVAQLLIKEEEKKNDEGQALQVLSTLKDALEQESVRRVQQIATSSGDYSTAKAWFGFSVRIQHVPE
ncbi:hypothetical protein EDD11_000467 [Mortierella claussenii]|nr:hypothetical protein EDD11_000467 [Mortierella claussenii]